MERPTHTLSLALALLVAPALVPVASADTNAVEGFGPELWVDGPANVQPGNGRDHPDATVDTMKRSIFVWDANNHPSGDNSDIFLRRFDSDGQPLEDPIFVNTFTDNNQLSPRIAAAADGSFLVIWQSVEADNRRWVRSQAFDTNAIPVNDEQLLNTLATGESVDINADVAALVGGGYVVVWRSRNTNGNDPNLSIQARRVNADGSTNGGQLQVNSTIGQNDRDPAVAELADGGFLVVWTDPEVHGRRFDATGSPVGNDFQVNNSPISTGQLDPDVALGWDGRILVVWKDAEAAGDDFEVRGRLYHSALTPMGGDFRINDLLTGVQDTIRVGDFGSDGFFVIWESESSNGNDIDPRSTQARIVTGSNEFAAPQVQINIWTAGDQGPPAIGGGQGRLAVVWRSQGNPDTSNSVITAQFWDFCDLFCDDFEWGNTWRWFITIP